MTLFAKSSKRSIYGSGVHAGGCGDFEGASKRSTLYRQAAKLERRIASQCHPESAWGYLLLILRKRLLLRKIKNRLRVPYAMFLNNYGDTVFARLANKKNKQNKSEMATPRKPSD